MSRNARIVLPGVPHHITQRGSRRQDVFFSDEDRVLYLGLLRHYATLSNVQVLSYCLMKNHVHLLVVPNTILGLASLLKPLHMRYAQQINVRNNWTGHLWQARFYSSPLDNEHFWVALRYIEMNPVRAGIVKRPEDYKWSSAHLRAMGKPDPVLNINDVWTETLSTVTDWRLWLADEEDYQKINSIRQHTLRDLPCGTEGFVNKIEVKFNRFLKIRKRGRPSK